MMIINEDFFDSDIDITVSDENTNGVGKNYQHNVFVEIDGPIKKDYVYKCLSNISHFEFDMKIEEDGDFQLKIYFNSEMKSLENVKTFFKMIYAVSLGKVDSMMFDAGTDNVIPIHDYMFKTITLLIVFPKDVQRDSCSSDYNTIIALRDVSDLLCNKSGEYPDCHLYKEIENGFRVPEQPSTFRSFIEEMRKQYSGLKGFFNIQKYDIGCPKGMTSRVVISHAKLFDLMDNFDFKRYSVSAIVLNHKEHEYAKILSRETINQKHPLRRVVSNFINNEDMFKQKKYLLDEMAVLTAMKINKTGFNEIALIFPFWQVYVKRSDAVCYYYLVIKWNIDNFPNHLEIADEIFEDIII